MTLSVNRCHHTTSIITAPTWWWWSSSSSRDSFQQDWDHHNAHLLLSYYNHLRKKYKTVSPFSCGFTKDRKKKSDKRKKRVELHERLRQLYKVVGFSFLFSFSNSHTFFGVLSVNDVYLKSKLVKREKKESAIELKVVDMCVHVHCTWTSLNITEKKVERILHYKRTWNERGRENKDFFIHVQQEQWLRRMYYRSSLQRRVRYCYHQGKVNEGAKVKALL